MQATIQENNMRKIKIEKITLNIGTGMPGEKLDKAVKLLQKMTEMTYVITKTKKRIPTWGIRPGLEIGCKVTVRGKKAYTILKNMLAALNNTISSSKFDSTGNLSFGVNEYINIPTVEYDPVIGIIGIEIAVTLARPGFRIRRRVIKNRTIPKSHFITKDEAIEFIKSNFNVQVN